MRSVARQGVRLILRMSLTTALAWVFPGPSLAQTPPASHEQFAGINESLMHTADALLAAPASADKTGKNFAAEKGSASSANAHIEPNQQSADGRKGSATATRPEQWRSQVTRILVEEGVPAELTAVIIVESGGNPMALSPKGARGLWQLMPDTARRYGLAVDNIVDERLNVEKSTHAAARYLKDLYIQFGSWPLALAAYNTGEQNLQRAIDRSRSNEFSGLSSLGLLPLETRNYVPAVLTTMSFSGRRFVLDERRPPTTNVVFALDSN